MTAPAWEYDMIDHAQLQLFVILNLWLGTLGYRLATHITLYGTYLTGLLHWVGGRNREWVTLVTVGTYVRCNLVLKPCQK